MTALGLLLILPIVQEEQFTILKAHREPYQDAVQSYDRAAAKLETEPEEAIKILTEILADGRIEHRECRLKIEVGPSKFSDPRDFHPYQLRGRARMKSAKGKDSPEALKLVRGAIEDFRDSIRRKVASEKDLEGAEALKRSLETKAEPPKNDPAPEQVWREKFEKMKPRIAYLTFRADDSDSVREAKDLLASTAVSSAEVEIWLTEQVDRLPREAGPKQGWLAKKEEAVRIVRWNSMIAEVLPAGFEKVRDALKAARSRFEPVARFRGKMTLKIFILPYAKLRSLQVGEEWVVRDGKRLPDADLGIAGENLSTPLVIRGLDIEKFHLVLLDEKDAEHTIEIPGDKLEDGRTYLYAGALGQPKSLRLRSP